MNDGAGVRDSPGECLPAPMSHTGRPTRALAAVYRVISKQPDPCNLAEVLEPSLSLLAFVNWIFSGDTRTVYTEILDSQIFLISNYFQYFVPKVLHRGPLAGNSMIKALSWEREKTKRIWKDLVIGSKSCQ